MTGRIDPIVEALGLSPRKSEAFKKFFEGIPKLPYTGYHTHSVARLTAPGRAICSCGVCGNLKINDVIRWDDAPK